MKLDSKAMRHLTSEDWRVLTAVEMGSKNHELVPTPLIEKLARLRGGSSGVHKSISNLAKVGLISRVKEAKYDGYRLTYGGLDYLALHAHSSRRVVYSVGTRIGVGKESDIMIVADNEGRQRVLKIHRLGRISFRTVKANRDYLRKKRASRGASWMYLSRLAAMKEYAFMRALAEEGFPVPEPLGQSRHTIVMSLVDAPPLRQISSVPDPAGLYAELMLLILRLAKHGLIHGDFNEFNILIKEGKSEEVEEEGDGEEARAPRLTEEAPSSKPVTSEGVADRSKGGEGGGDATAPTPPPPPPAASTTVLKPVLIDFPQMVSMQHQNAEMYFDRDVACVKRFFERRFHFVSDELGPFFADAKKSVGSDGARRLDAAVEASGFTKKMLKDLDAAIQEQVASRGDGEGEGEGVEDDAFSSEDDEDEEVEDVELSGEGAESTEGLPPPSRQQEIQDPIGKLEATAANLTVCDTAS